jgi:hypothetical protein
MDFALYLPFFLMLLEVAPPTEGRRAKLDVLKQL